MKSLHHAYIVEGEKDDAKAHIFSMLEKYDLLPSKNIDSVVAEFVNFSIDDARALKGWQMLSATGKAGKAFVAICDFINIEAQNALLKTFEEPTNNTHIFLSVKNSKLLLPTLLSRVELVEIKPTEDRKNARASLFINMNTVARLEFVSDISEKSDDPDASSVVRSNAISFINELEMELGKDVALNSERIKKLFELKKYLQMSGASTKMILETVAISV